MTTQTDAILTDAPPHPADETETDLLLQYLRQRDYPCPRCDYNLCNLSAPVCPECGEQLRLTIGRRTVRYGMLILTMAPGIFSGMMSGLIIGVVLWVLTFQPSEGLPPVEAIVTVTFGVLSGVFALLLFRRRSLYLNADRVTQVLVTAGVWLIHIGAFALLVLTARGL